MKRYLFFTVNFLFSISLFSPLLFAEEVTLEEAVSIALKTSEQIRIIEHQAGEIRMTAKETTAFIKPQISLSANYTKMDNNLPSVTSSIPPGVTSSNSLSFADKDVGAELQGSQLLYAGRRIWRSLDLSKSLNEQATLQESAGKRDIRQSVANAFHAALFKRDHGNIQKPKKSEAR